MAHPEFYVILNDNQKIIFAAALIVLVVIMQIVTKLRSKSKKVKRQQINRIANKNSFKIDYDEFLKAVYKKQDFIGQAKSGKIELLRLLNY